MNTVRHTQLSPIKRNGVTAYLQRYLDTITDWQTYTGASGDFSQTLREVTAAFFSSQKLKGAALLLAAHLVQQATASLVSIVVRTALHGQRLETYRGLAIRHSQAAEWWERRAPARLRRRVQMSDSFYFHESGRTWHGYTLSITLAENLTRTLAVLSLLSFPNRIYYFDRAIAYSDAIELALGLQDPDNMAGFIGDIKELDCLMPAIRTLKVSLYALNWLLVDADERDNGGLDVAGYNDLGYPSGPRWGGGAAYPPAPGNDSPPYGPGGRNPYNPTGSGYHPMPSNPYSSQAPYPRPTNQPPYAPTPPHPYASPPRLANPPEVTLVQSPVRVKLSFERPDGSQEPLWYTIQENAYLVLNGQDRQTGLAVAPLLEARADGAVRELTNRWSVVHLETGYLLSTQPLDSIYQARELAALLTGADWTRPFDQMSQDELDQARRTVQDFLDAVNAAKQQSQPRW